MSSNPSEEVNSWVYTLLHFGEKLALCKKPVLVKHVHKAINLVFDEVRGSCKPCLHDLRYVEEMLKRAKIWNLYASKESST